MPCLRSWIDAGLAAAVALAAAAAVAQQQPTDLPPAGFGTLRQDQVQVRLGTENLAVRALPLDERVIRLLSPDSYRSLSELVQSRASEIAAAARAAGQDSVAMFLVTFFGLQPQVRFNPDQVYISSQNTFFRPIGVVPLTPRWSEYQIDQRQQAAAIYLFEPGIAVLQPFTVRYGERASEAWSSVLRLLDAERTRVLSRASQPPSPPR
jgi:hypothetical protein